MILLNLTTSIWWSSVYLCLVLVMRLGILVPRSPPPPPPIALKWNMLLRLNRVKSFPGFSGFLSSVQDYNVLLSVDEVQIVFLVCSDRFSSIFWLSDNNYKLVLLPFSAFNLLSQTFQWRVFIEKSFSLDWNLDERLISSEKNIRYKVYEL